MEQCQRLKQFFTLLGWFLIWRKSLVGILLVFSCWEIATSVHQKGIEWKNCSWRLVLLHQGFLSDSSSPWSVWACLQEDATLMRDGEAAGNTSLLALLFLELIIRTFRSSALTRGTVSATNQRYPVKMSSQNEFVIVIQNLFSSENPKYLPFKLAWKTNYSYEYNERLNTTNKSLLHTFRVLFHFSSIYNIYRESTVRVSMFSFNENIRYMVFCAQV